MLSEAKKYIRRSEDPRSHHTLPIGLPLMEKKRLFLLIKKS